MPFLEGSHRLALLTIDGLVSAYTKPPSKALIESNCGALFLGNSNGNVYYIILDQSPRSAQFLQVANVFKTNPVSQALHFSQRREGNILFVGGEMADTILYLVHLNWPSCNLDSGRSI